jgi:hypothetical protein
VAAELVIEDILEFFEPCRGADGRNDFHCAAADFALKNIDHEDPFHQLGPREIARTLFCCRWRRRGEFKIGRDGR